jgi:PAS domain-containing protein
VSPHLRLVPAVAEPQPQKTFCGHCGAEPETDIHGRVCESCGLGVLLTANADAAPGPTDPFMVVDGSLCVCAVSRLAEELLGTDETEAVNRHLSEFLVPADAEAASAENLMDLVINAAGESAEARVAVVRPPDEFGIRFRVQVGACGPPRAALLVLSDGWD